MDGLFNWCKSCVKENAIKNKEHLHIYHKEYNKNNKEKLNNYQKEYYEKNKEKILKRTNRNRQAKLEHYKNKQRDYNKKNPEKKRASKQKRKTRKTNAGGSFTAQEFQNLIILYNNCCAYCDISFLITKIHADHIVPISKGGTSNIDNIIPACSHCNLSKGNKDVDIWFYKKFNKIWKKHENHP